MILSNKIFSHRTIGITLIVLITVITAHVHGQFDFTLSTDIAWDEQHGLEGGTGGASLANLNSRLDRALTEATDATLCYVLSGTPSGALAFNNAATSCSAGGLTGRHSLSPNWLVLKLNQHVDYELGSEQLLTIMGYDDAGVAQGKFEVNLIISDYDERPLLKQKSSDVTPRYWRPGDSTKLVIFDLFEDPEGANIVFDTRSISTDVWVCDTANGGEFTIAEVPDVPARTAGPGTPVSFTSGDANANCSVSNLADPTASPAPDPNPGTRGSGGNRVVTTKIVGPFLEITADSLADDSDGDGIVTDRGIGTYAARIFIRAWSGPSDPPLSTTEFAIVDVLVKVGANNPPQFAGGSTGFSVSLTEGNDETAPFPAWAAGDLDAGGSTNDSLTYSLDGKSGKAKSVAGGTVTLIEYLGDNPSTSETETDFVVALALRGQKLDYEIGRGSFELGIFVTDGWSNPVRVPIQISLIDVNEIEVEKQIEDQRLINGLSTKFDLTKYFSDPEGDEITFEAYTNIHTDIVEVNNDADTLTIHGKYATAGEGGESTVTVTVFATDSKGKVSDPIEFDLTTRYENLTPSIDSLEGPTVALGANIFEADSAGKVLLPLIAYTDDAPEPAPTALLKGNGASLFETIVNPYINEKREVCSKGSDGCIQEIGKIAIVVGRTDLNFEATALHKLSLALRDGWQPELISEAIEYHVAVNDSNDAPTIVKGTNIADQSIVVHGSDWYHAGSHFVDEDGDRLRVYAESSDEKVVEVKVAGLADVSFEGLKVGEATIELTAVDLEGASANLSFKVKVGPNNPPVIDQKAVEEQLPRHNVLLVAEFVEIELNRLFSEPDSGDMITSIKAVSSDDDVLLAIPTNEGETTTLVGRKSGTATLTITALDQGGNATSIENEITINAPPVEAVPIDAVTLNRTTPLTVDIADVFTDDDHEFDELLITPIAIGEGVDRVSLEVKGTQLTISGVMGASPGEVEIQLIAKDPLGSTATSNFLATVINIGPTVAANIGNQELDRINPLELDVGGVFDDADGNIQTIIAMVADETIVETSDIDDSGMLTLNGRAIGSTTITLTATDDNDAYTIVTFDVIVANIAPIVAVPIADHSTTRVDDLVIDISLTFDDPDANNDLLKTNVVVEDASYVQATLEGTMLTIRGIDVGESDVTLTTADADGGKVETSFVVTILNVNPIVAFSIIPIHLEVGGDAVSQSIASLFVDDDPLSYTISIADTSIARATIDGDTAIVGPLTRGSTILEIVATDPHGASVVATGSVTVSDAALQAVAAQSLAGFGRSMIASISSSIGMRVELENRSSDRTLDSWVPAHKRTSQLAMTVGERNDVGWNLVSSTHDTGNLNTGHTRGIDALRSLFGRDFAMNLGIGDDLSRWAVWGSGDLQSYEGDGYDGIATSFSIGADVEIEGGWVLGLALSSNVGESDYSWGTATQSMDIKLSSVLPYVSYRPTDGTLVWGIAGFGSGELETTVIGSDNHVSSLNSRFTMMGTSTKLKDSGRFNLALRADAASAVLETDESTSTVDDSLATDVTRIRVGLESTFRAETKQGRMLEPFGQISLRSDGGDGDTGSGIELVGGIRISSQAFSIAAHGRSLVIHGSDEYSESGFSLLAKLNPASDGTGVQIAISPRWGFDALGNEVLWQNTSELNANQPYRTLAGFSHDDANKSIDAHIAYGLLIANEHYLLTPFIDVGVGDVDRREALFGVNLRQSIQSARGFDVNLALGRIEDRIRAPTWKVSLVTTMSF